MQNVCKNGASDRSLPIFLDHDIFLIIKKVRWSDYSGEDRSKWAFFPHSTL